MVLPECATLPRNNATIDSDPGTRAIESDPPSCFLDAFPNEALGIVLRYFSGLPKVKYWEPYIPLETIIELYGVKATWESS